MDSAQIVTTILAFGDAKMTTALLDRLRHHRKVAKTGNERWHFNTVSEQACFSKKH